jgi:hypothetical protein
MFGIAIGRGIKVEMPTESIMFYAPPYGYQMTPSIDREAFETRATEIANVMEKTFSQLNEAKGFLNSIVQRITEAQAIHADEATMAKLGKEYEDAQNAYEQAIANHAFVNGQHFSCIEWQARVEKAMEYNGEAQALLGQKDDKWSRVVDKAERNKKVVPGDERRPK